MTFRQSPPFRARSWVSPWRTWERVPHRFALGFSLSPRTRWQPRDPFRKTFDELSVNPKPGIPIAARIIFALIDALNRSWWSGHKAPR
jgi:hypothetical protein